MAEPTDDDDAQPGAPEQLESGAYEIICGRLATHGKELRARLDRLNEARRQVFGAIDTKLLGATRVTTANNCVPRDIVSIGDKMLFGYNVHIGLRSEVSPQDVFRAVHVPRRRVPRRGARPAGRRALPTRLRRGLSLLQGRRLREVLLARRAPLPRLPRRQVGERHQGLQVATCGTASWSTSTAATTTRSASPRSTSSSGSGPRGTSTSTAPTRTSRSKTACSSKRSAAT